MAEIAFDTLQYARRLKAAGVPEQQAEVQAELMGKAFGYYVGELVTKDYFEATLGARLAQMETRIDTRMDALFNTQQTSIEARFIEQGRKIDEQGHRIDARGDQIAELATQMAVMRAEMNGYFKLHGWMLAALTTAVLLPIAMQVGQVFLDWAY